MIFTAILVYILGHYIPSWVYKKSISTLRKELQWKQVLFEFSGLITCFIVSFAIIAIVTLTTKEKYLLNKNAVDGIEFSKTAEDWGFRDGDKVISINQQEVVLFKDIIPSLISSNNDPNVLVKRGDSLMTLTLNQSTVLTDIIDNGKNNYMLIPRNLDNLTYNTKSRNFRDAISSYRALINQTLKLLGFSESGYKGYGGFVTFDQLRTMKEYAFVFALNLLFIGFINLLPMPGFDLGNALLIGVQKLMGKRFNQRKLQTVRITFQVAVPTILILFIFLG